MSWFSLAIIAYLLLSAESVANKFLISGKVRSWQVYLFYVVLLSSFSFLLFPLGLQWEGWDFFLLSVLSGVFFFFYLFTLFRSLKRATASRTFVVVGAVSALASIPLSALFLGEEFSHANLLGIVFLLVGSLVMSFQVTQKRLVPFWHHIVLAGIFFALFSVLFKYSFLVAQEANFISGYIYSRVGLVLSLLFWFLVFKKYRHKVLVGLKKKSEKKHASNFGWTLLVKTVAGVAAIMLDYSKSIGEVAKINALSAVQYLFIFLISVLLGLYFKEVLGENLERKNFYYKLTGAVMVMVGVMLISDLVI